jgi:hypothetical protein
MTARCKQEQESDGPTMTGDEKWHPAEQGALKEKGGGKISAVPTRILEKQNRLQMSQVLFLGPGINHQVALLFKDSKSEAAASRRCHAERVLPTIASRWSEARPR